MKLVQVYRNVHSGQNKGCFLSIQVRYTLVHFICTSWRFQGLMFRFLAPVEISGCEKIGFSGHFLPALDKPVCQWPKWYRWLDKKFSYRFSISHKDLTADI